MACRKTMLSKTYWVTDAVAKVDTRIAEADTSE